jgi:cytochrome c oxidase subunit 4
MFKSITENIDNTENTEHNHIIGYSTYIVVWLTLVGLTILTVTSSSFEFGALTLVVAMGIAILKSSLVINIFMHIKYDNKIFLVFIFISLIILLVCFLFTAIDVFFR